MKYLTLFVTILYFHLPILGQGKIPEIHTPNVSTLTKFIDFPVDKSTGVPSISIPIYDLNVREFRFPVSLAYHAGGIRVEQESSNVGLGWALIAEGIITRTIKGYPDELGWYRNHGPIAYRQPTYVFDAQSGDLTSVLDLMQPWEDTEPDIYSFSVNGYSGKFVFDKYRKVHLLPEQDIRIQELDTTLTSFKIVTPDGSQYIFGSAHEYVDVYDGVSSTGNMWPTTIHLSTIITPTLRKIEFEYINDTRDFHKVATHGAGPIGSGVIPNTNLPPHNVVVYGYKISKIKSELCNIEFKYKNQPREDCNCGTSNASNIGALDTIKVIDIPSLNCIKTFAITTSYFVSNTYSYYSPDDYLTKRLRLDALKECDASGNCLPPYKFTYNKYNKTNLNLLPNKISFGQDAWGYYNGDDDNETLYPTLSVLNQVIYNGVDRSGNEDYIKAFILDEIIAPTGGVTSYEYEGTKNGGVNSTVIGGLRIKQIVSTPGSGQLPIVKSYEYGGAYMVGTAPSYVSAIAASDLFPLNSDLNPPECNTITNTYPPDYWAMTDPLIISTGITSQFLFHEKVTEITNGTGFVESYYDVESVYDESADLNNSNWPIYPSMPLLSSGKLLKEIYKSEKGIPIKEINYTYSKFGSQVVDFAYKLIRPFCIQRGNIYTISSGFSYLVQKNELDYGIDEENPIVTSTSYVYGLPPAPIVAPPLYHFPKKVTILQNDSTVIVTRYKYPLDYEAEIGTTVSNDLWDQNSKGIEQAIKDYRIGNPIEEIKSRIIGGTELIIEANLNFYKRVINNNDSLALLDKISNLNIGLPITFDSSFISKINKTNNSYSFLNNQNYHFLSRFTEYDSTNNLIETIGRDGVYKSFTWGYKNNYLIGSALNSKIKDLFYTSFEDSSGNDIVTDGIIGNKSRINGFQKVIQNLTNGDYSLTYWNKANNIWSLQETVVTVSSGNYNLNLVGQVDEVRFSPKLSHLTTYTYIPNIGVSDANDLNNIKASYEYDSFQRVRRIRDNNNNVIKQFSYVHQSETNTPKWISTGNTRCKKCLTDTSFVTNIQEKELKDTSSLSPTLNKTIWVYDGPSISCYGSTAVYQFTTASPRCVKDSFNKNLGGIEKQVVNVNPCSDNYNHTYWMYDHDDTITCPLPTIYAKIELGNVTYFETETDADIEIHFFSDSACTQPYATPQININYRENNNCTSATNNSDPYCTGEIYTLLYNALISYVDGNNQNCTIDYSLRPGFRYIIIN